MLKSNRVIHLQAGYYQYGPAAMVTPELLSLGERIELILWNTPDIFLFLFFLPPPCTDEEFKSQHIGNGGLLVHSAGQLKHLDKHDV